MTTIKFCQKLKNIHVTHVHIIKGTRSNVFQNIGGEAPAKKEVQVNYMH